VTAASAIGNAESEAHVMRLPEAGSNVNA